MIKPINEKDGRAILRIAKNIRKNEQGEEILEFEQIGKVIATTDNKRIRKGSNVIPVLAAWIPINSMETKKEIVVALDFEDIVAEV